MLHELTLHTDSGHGWLEVPAGSLFDLGIAGKVSRYSYVKGNKVYLEEDRDAGLYLDALTSRGDAYDITENYQEHSPIRNYVRFELEA